MRIDFECSGGFAGLQTTYHADTDALPKQLSEELLKLVKRSGVFDLRQTDLVSKAEDQPDALSYELSLREHNRSISLSFNDATAPPKLQPLLALLQRLAFDQRKQ